MPRKRKPKARKRLQRVSIKVDHRQPVDWDKFAWALVQHVRLQQAAKQKPESK